MCQDRADTALQHRAQRFAAILVHLQEMLCRELDRGQGVLDLVCHLPRHFGPRLEPVCAFELLLLLPQLDRHAIEGCHQLLQFVCGFDGHLRIEVASRHLPGGAR